MQKIKFLFVSLFIIISLLIGCSYNKGISDESINEIRKITYSINNLQKMDDGLLYEFKIENGSKYTIMSSEIYLIYPLIFEQENKKSIIKIEPFEKTQVISPGEQIIISILSPISLFNELIDADYPQLEMKGYINEITIGNMFQVRLRQQE